jgi:hypothetical protein
LIAAEDGSGSPAVHGSDPSALRAEAPDAMLPTPNCRRVLARPAARADGLRREIHGPVPIIDMSRRKKVGWQASIVIEDVGFRPPPRTAAADIADAVTRGKRVRRSCARASPEASRQGTGSFS